MNETSAAPQVCVSLRENDSQIVIDVSNASLVKEHLEPLGLKPSADSSGTWRRVIDVPPGAERLARTIAGLETEFRLLVNTAWKLISMAEEAAGIIIEEET